MAGRGEESRQKELLFRRIEGDSESHSGGGRKGGVRQKLRGHSALPPRTASEAGSLSAIASMTEEVFANLENPARCCP